MSRKTINILGVKVDSTTFELAEAEMALVLKGNRKAIFATPNSEFIVRAQDDCEFREILNKKSRLNLPDSIGLLWAAEFLSLRTSKNIYLRAITLPFIWLFSILIIPLAPRLYHDQLREKISGSDFIWTIAKFAAKNHFRIFLFGGAPTVAERAALKLQTDIFDLRVAGVMSGDLSKPKQEIIDAINKSKAEILLVCLGSPLQEHWLEENLSKTCCKLGIGLGGTFDFVAGVIQRAPKWMQNAGLEWLFRLLHEPKRIGRQLALPKLALLILKEKILHG